ncbi:MAG: family 20 glycosylhydrolase, partial [Acutalibacteraceae bacterium]
MDIIAEYFGGILHRNISVAAGSPRAGDIYFELTDASELGEEGCFIEIGDVVRVSAYQPKGALYGGTTLTQILSQSEGLCTLPKGMIRDYPAYEVRAFMQDVARIYIPLDNLTEVAKYMAYFKLNELRVHINDIGGEQEAAFRVESKKYPEINSSLDPSEVYSQEDYKAFQREAAKYGVDVVTEIDTPAHSGFAGLHDKSMLIDRSHLDLTNPDVLPFIKSLLDEFLDGEDPVFIGKKFHIGTDEYDKKYSEDVRAYMNELIEYVSAKGREVRMWASLGSNGFVGEAPVSTNATAHYWSQNWANYAEMIDMGYACINNCDGCLYSVPGAGYYHDYIPTWWLHDNWFVNLLSGSYNHIAESHPLLRGAEAACWYDVMAGMSEYDIFDRAKEQILVMSEKNWCGSQRVDSADQFCSRLALFGKTSPLGNPARYIASAGDVIADYDFDNISGGVLRDNSGNGYTAAIHGLDTVVSGGKNALVFNQSGYISLPFDGIGFPYSVSFDLYINEGAAPDSVLFSGEDGTLYLNYKGTGKIAYERNCSRCYPYIFDCAIEEGMWNNIQLICDKKDMSLYLNGSSAGTAKYYNAAGVKQESSTFVLPVTEIGKGVSGMMRSLTVWNRALSEDEASGVSKLGEENLALKKKVTVSGLEVQGALTGEMAVDGDPATRALLERKHDSWLYVDLGEVRTVGRIEFDWAHRPNKFNLQVSEDGQTWTVVYEDLNCAGNTEGRDVFTLPSPVRARYVKYNQIEMFRSEYGQFSGTFYEMEVYENRYSNADVIAQA